MNEKLAAADAAKRFVAQWSALIKGFEVLGSIGSLEQAHADALARITQLTKKEQEARKKLADAEHDRGTADDLYVKAAMDIDAKLTAAGAQADAITKEAQHILDHAREEAQRIVAKAQADGKEQVRLALQGARDRLADHEARVTQARQQVSELGLDLDAKRAALTEVHAAIEKLKQH